METHFCSLWFAVANAESQDAYDETIALLRKKAPAKFVDYVEQTWLPYASKFVAFHTNHHFHLGQRTSSRVEGAHAKLKRQLQSSRCDVHRLVETCISVVSSYLQLWQLNSALDSAHTPIRWLGEEFFVDILRKVSAEAIEEVSATGSTVLALANIFLGWNSAPKSSVR